MMLMSVSLYLLYRLTALKFAPVFKSGIDERYVWIKRTSEIFQECLSFSVHAINCLRVELSVGYDADFPFSYVLTARVQKRQLISFVKENRSWRLRHLDVAARGRILLPLQQSGINHRAWIVLELLFDSCTVTS